MGAKKKEENVIKVLLIEDNPGDARLLEVYLEEAFNENYTLVKASRLAEGIKNLQEKKFDIVILDLSLPDSSGIDTFRRIFEVNNETTVIVLTGYADEDLGTKAVKTGAQDFLMKNDLNSHILKRAINYAIERNRLKKELSERTRKLEINDQSLREAQRIAHLGSWELQLSSKTITCSEEVCRIYNINPDKFNNTLDEFLGKIYSLDRESVKESLYSSSKHKSITFKHRVTGPDKELKDIYVRGYVTRDKNNNIVVTGTSQDITERKRGEELQKLAMMVTTSYNSVYISDKKGNIEWVNEGFTKLSGYTLEDVKGAFGERLRKTKDTCFSYPSPFLKKILKEKKPFSFECKNFTKNGSEYWVITTLTPMLNDAGDIDKIVAIEADITSKKRVESELKEAHHMAEEALLKANKALEELTKAKKQVEETAKAKEQFLANMSHEIRTPMNGIIGLTRILLNTSLSPAQKEYLSAIKISGDTLLVVINDILDISKMEAGKMTFESIPFKIHDVVDSVTDLMLPKAKEKNVEIRKHIEENIPRILLGDPTRLNQIITNLMSNAVKFTKKGYAELSIKLLEEDQDMVHLEIRIKDTGRGIPKNKIPTIYQDFTQVSAEISRKYGGTGLGLAITKRLVELLGGKITVESKLNEGSTFIVQLPFNKSSDEHKFPDEFSSNDEPGYCELLESKVLVVEDNAVNQLLAEKLLTDWGCTVDIAENGKIAINKLNKKEYDIVLMDIKMPEMDGYETTRYIREKMPSPICNIPILAATAHAATWEAEKCIKAGMNGYISKPFDLQELCDKLTKLSHMKTLKDNEVKAKNETDSNAGNHYTDLTYLNAISRGSEEFIVKMIKTFLTQAEDDISTMKKHLQENNYEGISFTAHKMKPSFHFIGIEKLKETIIELEKSAREKKNLESVPDLVKKVVKIFEGAKTELNEALGQINPKLN